MGIKALMVAAITASFAAAGAFAENQEVKPVEEVGGLRLGELSCKIDGGWGLLLGSSKAATCTYVKADGTAESYAGKLNKIGVDIGKTDDAYMTWAVFTANDVAPGANALAGKYAGFSAEAALGIGLGANALIGDNDQKIGLQPVIQGSTGLNLAVGLASLNLEAVGG